VNLFPSELLGARLVLRDEEPEVRH
jgi:hypothetical protein